MNYEEYHKIVDLLQTGTEEDWEFFVQEIFDFPNGNDDFIGCAWITNAIDLGSLMSVEWMLSKNINLRFVDSEGYSVLHSCIDRKLPDKYKILQLLIDKGADINIGAELGQMAIESWTPLHMAAHRNDLGAIKILLQNGADTTIKTIIDHYCTAEQTALNAGNNDAAELIKSRNKLRK